MRRTWAMMSSFSRFSTGMSLALATVLISGCATSNLTCANEASVLLERILSEDVLISEMHAYEDEDELVIYGKVKRAADNCCDTTRGWVEIAVVAPDGLVLDVVSVSYKPRNIPKVRSRSSNFMARLPYTVPQGFVLRITYRTSLEVANSITHIGNTFVREQTIAIPDEES
jgi:hypothetical protein